MEEAKPLVSVIIPTLNSEPFIKQCLSSIFTQSYKNIEIIVVDNYSTDKTVEFARDIGAKVFLKGNERCAQKNYGAHNSKGEYLFFIDSDMELTINVIDECIKVSKEKELDLVIIPEIPIAQGYWAKCKGLEKILVKGEAGYEGGRFVRRNVFFAVGGYDEELISGEDYDLHYRIEDNGYKIGRINSFILHHEGKVSIKKLISKYKYYGHTVDRFLNKHKLRLKKRMPVLKMYLKKWYILIRHIDLLPGWLFLNFLQFLLKNR